jgi:hypothetical protein
VIGAVLYQNLLLGGRGRRLHLLRWVCGGLLLLQFVILYAANQAAVLTAGGQSGAGLVLASHAHVRLLAWEQFLLVLAVTPAFVAGELTDAKASGTLQHLLTTRLRSWEILLGKLAAQGVTMAMLLALTFPLLCFSAAWLGLPLVPLVAQVLGMVLLVFLLGGVALLASVWSRNTSEAILSVYGMILGLLLLAWALQAALAGQTGSAGAVRGAVTRVLAVFEPDYLMEPAWADAGPAVAWGRLLAVALAWGGGGLVCLALACWRLRPAYARQLEAAGRGKEVVQARRPPVGDEPVLWREEYVEGVASLAALRRVPRWLGVVLVSLVSFTVLGFLYAQRAVSHADQLYLFQSGLGLVVTLTTAVVVGVRSSSAVSREREASTWEALLLTPLVAHAVIEQKFRGILRAARPYLLAYAVPALGLSLWGGFNIALRAGWWERGASRFLLVALTDFLLTVSWLAAAYGMIYCVGTAGLACSARARSSRRSLLAALWQGYGAGGLYCYAQGLVAGLFLWVPFLELFERANLGWLELPYALLLLPASAALLWRARIKTRAQLDAAAGAILKSQPTWTLLDETVREGQRRPGSRWGGWDG